MIGMAYYYTELLYLFMLFCLCSTFVGLIAGLYLFLLLCAKCADIIGRWIYKVFGPVNNWFFETVEEEKDDKGDSV